MPRRPAFASRAPPICPASTPSPRSIAPPATTSSDCCCRRARSLHVRPGARHQQFRHRLGQRHRRAGHLGAFRFRTAPRQCGRGDRARRPNPRPASKRTEFEVAVATADAYLTLAAAQETVRAAQAGVDRAAVLLRTITALVNAQLRPGADASRAEAELAAARTQLIQAQQATDVARATLAQFVGIEPAQIALDVSRLLQLPPEQDRPAARHRHESDRARAERRRRSRPRRSSALWNAPIFRASICRAPPTPAAPARRPTATSSAA